jgi:hypothetical protein
MQKRILLIDRAIGRYNAAFLVNASNTTDVRTLLMDSATHRGRLDFAATLAAMYDANAKFESIGIASNGPEIHAVFLRTAILLHRT